MACDRSTAKELFIPDVTLVARSRNGVSCDRVRRYRRQPMVAGRQVRLPRRLSAEVVREAQALYTAWLSAFEHDLAGTDGPRPIGACMARRTRHRSAGQFVRERVENAITDDTVPHL